VCFLWGGFREVSPEKFHNMGDVVVISSDEEDDAPATRRPRRRLPRLKPQTAAAGRGKGRKRARTVVESDSEDEEDDAGNVVGDYWESQVDQMVHAPRTKKRKKSTPKKEVRLERKRSITAVRFCS
jgi:hypothetical protein